MKKLSFFLFVLVTLTYSCKKKDSSADSFKQQLIGDWDWVNSTGGIDGSTRTPATDGRSKFIRFDSTGKCHSFIDGVEEEVMSFKIEQGNSKNEESRTITFSKKDVAPKNKQGYRQHVMLKGTDTLILQDDCDDCYTNLYVRSNGPSKPIIESDTLYNSGIDVYNTYLPAAFRSYITDYVTGWSIPKQSAWDKYWWDQYKKEKSLVNFISGDFNCDNNLDFAMILADQNGNTAAWAFLYNGPEIEKIMLEKVPKEEGPIGIGLELLQKGKQGDLNTNKTFNVKCEGITINFFEKAAHSYYWEKGKFKMIQTGD